MKSALRKSAYSAFTFFWILCVLSVGYSAYTAVPNNKTSGNTVSSTEWNNMANDLSDHESRIASLSGTIASLQASGGNVWNAVTWGINYPAGNVGIWTASPAAKLHVKWPLRIDAPTGSNEAGISFYADSWNTRRYIMRTSPDTGKDGDFEIIQMDKSTGTEINRITWPYNGSFRAPTFDIGYEIVNDSRVPWAWATTYNVYCPNGKYLLNSSVRTLAGWIEVAHDNLYNGILVLSDRNNLNSQLSSWVYSTLVCANVR